MPPKKSKTLGQRIREARDRAELTQGQVAAACGQTSQGISDIENDRRPNVSLEILHRVAVAIGCPPSELDPRLTDRVEKPKK